jgi:hypothetical protein
MSDQSPLSLRVAGLKISIAEATDFSNAFVKSLSMEGKVVPRRTVDQLEVEALEKFTEALAGGIYALSETGGQYLHTKLMQKTGPLMTLKTLGEGAMSALTQQWPGAFLSAIAYYGTYNQNCGWVRVPLYVKEVRVNHSKVDNYLWICLPDLLKEGNHSALPMVWRESLLKYFKAGGQSKMRSFMTSKGIIGESACFNYCFSKAIHTAEFKQYCEDNGIPIREAVADHRNDMNLILEAMVDNKKNKANIGKNDMQFFKEPQPTEIRD